MITIVSAKAQRLIKILNRLPRNYGYLSYESIQSFNLCSINPAYSDTKFILDQWEDILDLKLVDKGIISLNKSDSDFEYVRNLVLRDEFEFVLIWTIFSKPNLTTPEYSGILCCSESHFRKSVSAINQGYLKYQVEIKYNEKSRTWKFSSKSYVMGAQVLTRIAEICHFNLDNFENDTTDDTSLYFDDCLDECFEKEAIFFNKFVKILKYYVLVVEQQPLNVLNDIFNERIESNLSFEHFQIKIKDILDDFSLMDMYKFNTTHSPKHIYSYFYYLYFRDSLFDEWIKPESARYENVLHRLNNEVPQLITFIRNLLEQLDTVLKSNLSDNIEEILVWAYINIDYIRTPIYNKIGIISDLGKEHVNVLASLLYEHFDGIQCIDITNNPFEKSKDTDLIISNSKYILHQKNIDFKPHIVLSDVITIDEISSIYTMLYDIKQKRKVYDR